MCKRERERERERGSEREFNLCKIVLYRKKRQGPLKLYRAIH